MPTALVLSAGGMYGAYQAGAWRALHGAFQPDLVVGASVGALNAWAIAGGCSPETLIADWLDLQFAARLRWKRPRHVFSGIVDTADLNSSIQQLHGRFQPQTELAIVVTDLLKLRPAIVRNQEITWRHLAASAAIIGLYDQIKIDGRWYSDGGLLSALPIWAAVQLGATKVVALNVLPQPPGFIAHAFVALMKRLSPFQANVANQIELVTVMPKRLLGPPTDCLRWKRANAEAWIAHGAADAAAVVSHLAGWSQEITFASKMI